MEPNEIQSLFLGQKECRKGEKKKTKTLSCLDLEFSMNKVTLKVFFIYLNNFSLQEGEVGKSSSAINAKKQRKTIEQERLERCFKKIRDTKGTFHAKMGSIKDINGMNLTEAEDIKKRWQEYTEELQKKDCHDPDNHEGVITHLETDILECEVK